MVTVPKWQEPLVERAAVAERTLRAVMHAPGGGAGAIAAAAAADQDLAELCRAVAARSGSPLLQQLLVHGARALDGHAGVLLAATIDPDELAVPAPAAALDEDQAEQLDEDQALVEHALEPAETSDDASTNEQPQASLDDADAVADAADVEQRASAVADLKALNAAYAEARTRYGNAVKARPLALSVCPNAARAAADLVVILRRARDSGLFTGVALWAIEDATTLYETAAAGAP